MNNLISRFNSIVDKHPDQPALVAANKSLTYKTLNQHAKNLATQIHRQFAVHCSRPIASTDVIGVALEKGIDLYIALLAILETGASYVPLDPDLEIATRAHIIETCNCAFILANDKTVEWASYHTNVINLSSITYDPHPCRSTSMPKSSIINDQDAAYTIFTSGSTGKPKGVVVSHANVINLVDWCISQFNLDTATKTLQFSTINFDASILDIFPTFLSGGTLFIPAAEQRMSITALTKLCDAWEINHAFLPPSLLNALDPECFPTIKTLLTGGEPCAPDVVKKWSPERQLYNLYGPTECTVMACFKLMNHETDPQNIGIAIEGVQTFILDKNYEVSNEGELFIGGKGVSLGYRGQANVNNEKFIQLKNLAEGKLYRTGDFVKQEKNGDILFLGRIDRQVKIRGYRIELEEIEAALLRVGCTAAAVKVSEKKVIIAYIVVDDIVSIDELQKRLSSYLNPYKLPQVFVRLNSLPLKNNGKIDYQSLPAPVAEANNKNTETALSKEELALAKLWAQILEIDPLHIQPNSNFRELGGDSITIAMLLEKLENEFNVSIDFIEFFENPTIKFISKSLKNEETEVC